MGFPVIELFKPGGGVGHGSTSCLDLSAGDKVRAVSGLGYRMGTAVLGDDLQVGGIASQPFRAPAQGEPLPFWSSPLKVVHQLG